MTMAAVIESRLAGTEMSSRVGQIAHVDVVHDFGNAEAVWRELEAAAQFCTPYQRFDFQAAWQTHVGEREGLRPFILIAYDADRHPLLLLPLGVTQENGMRTDRVVMGVLAILAGVATAKHRGSRGRPQWRSDRAALVRALPCRRRRPAGYDRGGPALRVDRQAAGLRRRAGRGVPARPASEDAEHVAHPHRSRRPCRVYRQLGEIGLSIQPVER